MNLDLLGTVRLLHKVFGFLSQQTAEQLAEIADGRRRISLALPSDPPATAPKAEAGPQKPSPRKASAPARSTPADAIDAAPDGTDYNEIAAELRSQDSVDAGVVYLRGLKVGGKKPTKADLIGIGRAMGLTLPKSVTVPVASRKLIEHAIGARKKYAGLESW